MIKLFLKGMVVPTWLERQEAIKGLEHQFKPALITFGSMCVVWLYKDQYYVVKLGIFGSIFHVDGGYAINLAGQARGVRLFTSVWAWLT